MPYQLGASYNTLGSGLGSLFGGIGSAFGPLGTLAGGLFGLLGGGGGGTGGAGYGGEAPIINANPNVRTGGLSNVLIAGPVVGGAGGGAGGGGGGGGLFGLFGGGGGGKGGAGGFAAQNITQANKTYLDLPEFAGFNPTAFPEQQLTPFNMKPLQSTLAGGAIAPSPSTPYSAMLGQPASSAGQVAALPLLANSAQRPQPPLAGTVVGPGAETPGFQGQQPQALAGGATAPVPISAMGMLRSALEMSAYPVTAAKAASSGLVPPPPPAVPSMLSDMMPGQFDSNSPMVRIASNAQKSAKNMVANLQSQVPIEDGALSRLQGQASIQMKKEVDEATQKYQPKIDKELEDLDEIDAKFKWLENVQEREILQGTPPMTMAESENIRNQALQTVGPPPGANWNRMQQVRARYAMANNPAWGAGFRQARAQWEQDYRQIVNTLTQDRMQSRREAIHVPDSYRNTLKAEQTGHVRRLAIFAKELDGAIKSAGINAQQFIQNGLREEGFDIRRQGQALAQAQFNLRQQTEAFREQNAARNAATYEIIAQSSASRAASEAALVEPRKKYYETLGMGAGGGVNKESFVQNLINKGVSKDDAERLAEQGGF